jgi:hypothetical protein
MKDKAKINKVIYDVWIGKGSNVNKISSNLVDVIVLPRIATEEIEIKNVFGTIEKIREQTLNTVEYSNIIAQEKFLISEKADEKTILLSAVRLARSSIIY